MTDGRINQNHGHLAVKTVALSREAIQLIDSVLQPYCEDHLSRLDIVEEIRSIVVSDRRKRNSQSVVARESDSAIA